MSIENKNYVDITLCFDEKINGPAYIFCKSSRESLTPVGMLPFIV